MRNEDQTGVIVMDNSSEEVTPFVAGVFSILDKRKGYSFKDPKPAEGVKLEEYAGRYSEQPWGSEAVIVPWAGGLAYLTLPNEHPADAIELWKPKGGDIFRVIRKDGSEAEEIRFVRDAAGKVTSFVHFSNPTMRMP
jgi:hypothetical protein